MRPTQKMTYTIVGARLRSGVVAPSHADTSTATNRTTPRTRASTVATRAAASTTGDKGTPAVPSKRARGHKTARAANEATTAPPAP